MTVSQQAIDAAAEAIEDAAMRWIGRDLGTLHRNEIVEAGHTIHYDPTRAQTRGGFRAVSVRYGRPEVSK